jgi:hypothetical protein
MICIAHFFAAFFLVNGIPHFVQGVSGSPFQSPFASPPGVGESSAIVNVIWGFSNFIIGYVLLFNFGEFSIGFNVDTFVTGTGALLTGVALAWHFQRVRNSSA